MVSHLFNAKLIVCVKSTVTAKPCNLVLPHDFSLLLYYCINAVVSLTQCCSYLIYK